MTADVKYTVEQRRLSRNSHWWASAGGAKRAFAPMEIETKKQKSLEDVKSWI